MSATKIAIIEDDMAISQMYRLKFEAEGYEVETAENGKVGLELAEAIMALKGVKFSKLTTVASNEKI